jgi:ligand-binding sensor domain-containing protein
MLGKFAPAIFSFFFFVVSVSLVAQQRLQFNHIYADDGLSQSSIWAIAQDYQGFMWFGTFDGLNRYDGYSFKVYKHDPSILHSINGNGIEVIFEDSKHNLWIGTAEGLNLYNRAKDEFIRFYQSPRNPNKGTSIKAIYEDKNGKIWVGGGHGISLVDFSSRKLLQFTPGYSSEDNRKNVHALLVDQDDNLWAGTEDGLDFYNVKQKKFYSFKPKLQSASNNRINSVYSMLMDNTGTLWITTGCGVFIYSNESNNLQRVLPELSGEITDLYQTRDQSIFIGTPNALCVYSSLEKKIIARYTKHAGRQGLSDGSISCIYEDKDKNLWIGTFNGLNFTGGHPRFKSIGADTLQIKLRSPYILPLLEDNEHHLWVGTGKGIEILDVSTESIKQLTALHPALSQLNSAILSFTMMDGDNIRFTVWSKGIYQYNKKNKILKKILSYNPNGSLPLVYCDRYGKTWMGCESGLYFFDPKTDSLLEEDKIKNHNINYIQQDEKRGLWLGYELGLIHYNTITQKVTVYRGNHQENLNLSVNRIFWVYEDKGGLSWIGTNAGLHVLVDGVFESLWKKHGFPDHAVKAILEDGHNNLWISASDGLYRFNKKTKSVVKFDVSDGVQGKEFNKHAALKMHDGKMVFGGTKGLNIFHPDSIKSSSILSDVVITDFKILNKPVPVDSTKLKKHISVTEEIDLDHNDTEFSFEFVAINFSSPGKTQYAYKMEGYDREWNYSGTRRFASYTNLPTGKEYIFKVRASNSDNVWGEEASIKIHIHPPFWNTWWFKTMCYLAIAGIVYLAYRIRFNHLQKQRNKLIMQKRILQEQVYQRTLDFHRANIMLKDQSEELKAQSEQLKEQAEEIAMMNDMLKQDNLKLEHNVKDLEQARVLQKWVSLAEFKNLYPDNESCYKFIEEQKWGTQYKCKKCGNVKYSSAQIEYSRRCSKCNYIETITSGTIFEGVKFPINKAFYLLFLIHEGKRYTLKELADVVDLRPQTCWTFKKRVIERTKNKNLQKNEGGLSQLILLS